MWGWEFLFFAPEISIETDKKRRKVLAKIRQKSKVQEILNQSKKFNSLNLVSVLA